MQPDPLVLGQFTYDDSLVIQGNPDGIRLLADTLTHADGPTRFALHHPRASAAPYDAYLTAVTIVPASLARRVVIERTGSELQIIGP